MSLIQKLIIPVPALIFIALILLFLSNSNIAEADQNLIRELQEKISDRSNQIGAIEKEIEQSKKQLEAVGREVNTLQNAVRSIELTQKKLEQDISLTENKIINASLSIEKLTLEISESEQRIEKNSQSLSETLRLLNETGESSSLVESLLKYGDFSSVWEEFETLQRFQVEVRQNLNNLKIIITTNDAKPIFLKAKEEPKSENTNNFFIYRVPDVDASDINENLGQMLEERLGHYVRTELRVRFEHLMAARGKNNRYGIPAPITPLARSLFASAVTTIEIEAEELARHLIFGVNLPNLRNANAPNIYFKAHTYNNTQYVQFQEIRDLVGQLGFKGSPNSPKSYVTVLQEQGVLSHETDRTATKHLGYRIQRSKDYYTTTVSGMLPVCDDIDDKSASLKSDFHHSSKSSILNMLDAENDRNDEDDTTF